MESEETLLHYAAYFLKILYIVLDLLIVPSALLAFFQFSSFLLWPSDWSKALHLLPSSFWLSGHASFSSSALHLCHQQLHQSLVWCEVRLLHTNRAGIGCLSGRPAQWGHGVNIRQHYSAFQHHTIALYICVHHIAIIYCNVVYANLEKESDICAHVQDMVVLMLI